eukprot:Phypoly_transcript_14932.p1 GENE.Phypoly_transcript_14932~~Phypoly_transcript_14932.p1  ORF type:complete len:298 (+),score=38.19 Phypoly_transcript_14932:61-894(+)
MNANDNITARKYFKNRLLQSLANGENGYITEIQSYEWGVHASGYILANNLKEEFHSLYIFESHRGKGHFKAWFAAHPGAKIRTQPDCDIEEFLRSHHVPYSLSSKPPWPEYQFIESHYGNKKARRSGVHLINHIDEGLFILHQYGASELAKRAYAIHPLLQSDEDLKVYWDNRAKYASIDRDVLLLAMEYRNTANSYLSPMPSKPIHLSPLPDVNTMLIADKIQNRKDFEIYHKGTHEKSDRLSEYFSQWLSALGVSEEDYQKIVSDLASRSSALNL